MSAWNNFLAKYHKENHKGESLSASMKEASKIWKGGLFGKKQKMGNVNTVPGNVPGNVPGKKKLSIFDRIKNDPLKEKMNKGKTGKKVPPNRKTAKKRGKMFSTNNNPMVQPPQTAKPMAQQAQPMAQQAHPPQMAKPLNTMLNPVPQPKR